MSNEMDRRQFLKTIGACAMAWSIPGCGQLSPASEQIIQKPNFVFILIDDLGWRDLSCYNSNFYETPNIDKIAEEGMSFSDAYAASSVCSPTRASIMTGKYPARLDLTNYIAGRKKGKLLPAEYNLKLSLEETTFAEVFQQNGYKTGFVGKWHLGPEGYHPLDQGFDVNIAGGSEGHPYSYFYPYGSTESRRLKLPGGSQGEYLTDRLTEEALFFMDNNSHQPFLLMLSHYAVHTPLQAKKEITRKYIEKAELRGETTNKFEPEHDRLVRIVQDHAVYASMIESVDQSVGKILQRLKSLGLEDDTVVIFMSDNGGLSTAEGSPTSNLPLRAGKGWLYEGGIREPMIIKWPGVTKPASRCSVPVISNDFFATMIEIAGGNPADYQTDGLSLTGLLKGKKKLPRKAIYWHYPHYSNQGGKPASAIRMGDYKFIQYYEDNRVELFNLKKDIGEKNDLSEKMSRKVKQMQQMLNAWLEEVDAKMPTPNPDYEPDSGNQPINPRRNRPEISNAIG